MLLPFGHTSVCSGGVTWRFQSLHRMMVHWIYYECMHISRVIENVGLGGRLSALERRLHYFPAVFL